MTPEPPPPAPPSPGASDGADPSMEEILASIRRILNDDETEAAPPPPEEVAEVAQDDVLILDQSMLVSAAQADFDAPLDARPVEGLDDEADHPAGGPQGEPVMHDEPMDIDAIMAAPPVAEPPRPPVDPVTATVSHDPFALPASAFELLGPAAAAAAASSVGSLVRALAAGRATQVYAGGPTLEDLVRAELRPLLKEWLDVNLPPLVERLVRTEIERVVGRAVP